MPDTKPAAPQEAPLPAPALHTDHAPWSGKLRWFAAEILVVVVGVLIAFQINAWGQERADRAREQAYLRQLAADLRQTEEIVAETNAELAPREQAAGNFLRAFRMPIRPTRDALNRWRREASWLQVAMPVRGTVDGLIATGDLALIRNDALRSAISSYAAAMTATTQAQMEFANRQRDARADLNASMDMADARTGDMTPDELREYVREYPMMGIASGEQRQPFPYTVESVLTDRNAYNAANSISVAQSNMKGYREFLMEETRELRKQVEATIER